MAKTSPQESFVKNTSGKNFLSAERTPEITNYFLVPFRVRYIGILLYMETRLTLYVLSTSGDVQYIGRGGEVFSTSGGYKKNSLG